jgi:hypothetical protein
MRISSPLYRPAVIAALAIVASCSDSTGPSSNSVELQTAISQTMFGDPSSFSSVRDLTNVPGAAAPTFNPDASAYSTSDDGFTCPSKTVSGVTFQLKYFLFDASGAPLSGYDPATTASLRTVWDASGTFTTSGATPSTVVLDHHSDLRLDGLLGTTRTLNGSTTDNNVVDVGTGSQAVHIEVSVDGSATDVVLPAAAGQYPASGLLASDITIASSSGGSSTTVNARGTLAFSGTNTAMLTVNTGAGPKSCLIDLAGVDAPRCD